MNTDHIHWGEMHHEEERPMPASLNSSDLSASPPDESHILPVSPSRADKLHSFLSGSRSKTITGIILVVLLVLGVGLYVHSGRKPALDTAKPPLSDAAVIEAVGQLLLLPSDVTPTVADVTNLDEVKNDPFFAHAMPGDKVLIYPTLDNAILYSPSRDKIIAFTTIEFPSATSTASSTTASP